MRRLQKDTVLVRNKVTSSEARACSELSLDIGLISDTFVHFDNYEQGSIAVHERGKGRKITP
jgi:hypothetical protein